MLRHLVERFVSLLKLWSAHHSQMRCKGRTYPLANAEEESKTEHPINYVVYITNQLTHLFANIHANLLDV